MIVRTGQTRYTGRQYARISPYFRPIYHSKSDLASRCDGGILQFVDPDWSGRQAHSQDLRRAGLINILGTTGDTNVQGETVKKLDAIANDDFVKVFQHSGYVCALASEEMEKPISIPGNWPHGKYMFLFDPLDGSSNTDNNMPLGAIFSVLKYEPGRSFAH